ncbi:hypothetical protein GCM10025865_24390 [Paraoerskovia sediminicola]|uniref:AbiEi antitoxin N-terminal domain-containing protein n=1 Tax=Paraoerskovia sediminicola TaxID=1138587 RepID=A0ABN6XHR7_9CELL|nr:type IV toxin-antitoxin system AbiEi family antitoxin domain-containing protein [Paraoerskovia sediminicola]BDZ43140.1 hypothetical protein GCM10025865_24390 [Paraoerskovia sediminicola]
MTEPRTYLERLREIALDQHGYVSRAQARDDGVPDSELAKMVARERIERAAHGVYRIPQVPATRYDNWALAVLWTGAPEACLSHETALSAWDISDVNPDRIHLTVTRSRRLRRVGGDRYVVHHHDLTPDERTWFEGIPTTTVTRTIEDCIADGTPTYLVGQALERGSATSELTTADHDRLTRLLEARDGRR